MKILHLVIHNSGISHYEKMYAHLAPFYKNFSNVDTYFIEYSESIERNFVFDEDKLILRGKESMVPGLLWKTLDALLIFFRKISEYDYVIRSNVSTVVNIERLCEILRKDQNIDYLGGDVMKLSWLDPKYGIIDNRWHGTQFAQGTMIVMSKNLINQILNKRHKFRNDIVDDVAFGIFIRENVPSISTKMIHPRLFFKLSDNLISAEYVLDIKNKCNPVCWRNRSRNREIDIQNIETIINNI